MQAFGQVFLEQWRARPRTKYQLAVTLKHTRQLVVSCGIRLDAPGASEGDIGYELNPEHWGRSYATDAARAIVGFGFSELGLHRVWGRCVADNPRSARVLEKIGMRLEGRQRDKAWFQGRWWDRLLYAILEDECRAQQCAQVQPRL